MTKRYRCDYCDKMMVSTPSIIKIHNKGIVHQKLVQEHYQQFKDPETILAEESTKKPCTRYVQGTCQFGRICRFSHYTREEIDALRQYVASKTRPTSDQLPSLEDLYQSLQAKKCNQTQEPNDNTILIDSNGITHVFPWTYNPVLDNYGENLPPSIKRLKIDNFDHVKIMEWG